MSRFFLVYPTRFNHETAFFRKEDVAGELLFEGDFVAFIAGRGSSVTRVIHDIEQRTSCFLLQGILYEDEAMFRNDAFYLERNGWERFGDLESALRSGGE